ncbi:MAG TPA: TonB-dependent receptor, partial [Sphingobacterium sp.]|nr:TonB-dependent receptor [Sphingobacterium sp.]
GARAEARDLIPADQLGSMEVTKALTADMDGDAIGGNINLRTPTARSLKLQVRGDAGLGYNDLAGNINGVGRLRLAQRFLTDANNPQGKLGVMVSGSYYSTNNSEDRMDVGWNIPLNRYEENRTVTPFEYQFRKTENIRTRIGTTATLDYRVKNHEIIFNYMFNSREDDDLRNRYRFDLARNNTPWTINDEVTQSSTRVRRDINFWRELKTNHNFNLEGRHSFGDWVADWGVFYTVSKRDHTSTRGEFASNDIDIIIANAQRDVFSEVPELVPTNPDINLKNPLVLNSFRRYEKDMETTDGSNKVVKLNLAKDYTIAGHRGIFKIGGKIRQTGNSKFRDNHILAFYDPNQLVNPSEAFAHVIGRTEPISFLNDRFDYGPRVDRDRFDNYINRYRRLLTEVDGWDAERLSKNDTYDAYEDVYASYAMSRLQINKLLILAGLRYEYNSVNYDAFEVLREGTSVVTNPVSGGPDYGFLLPSVHLKYGLTPLSNLRFAYTQSYARPNFNDIVPFINYDRDVQRISIGNPELSASLANNLDLMYEIYDRKGGIISGGLFYKHIDQFQFTRSIPALTENNYLGLPETLNFRFEQEQNGEKAVVYGFELNLMQKLTQLPGAWSGLSAYLNYTYTGADANTQDRFDMSLPGQATHTGNASLAFDYKGFTSRVNLNYNGAFIHTVSSEPENDIFQDERFQLDVNFNQAITKRISLYAEFMNLTNSPSRRYQGYADRVYRLAYFGWWSRIGVNFRF